MKRYIALIAVSCLLLTCTGCSGTVAGRDKLEPAMGISNTGALGMITPTITVKTKVTSTCDKFFSNLQGGNYQAAYDMLVIPDKTFVTHDVLKTWSEGFDYSNYQVTEFSRASNKYAEILLGTEKFVFQLVDDDANPGNWKIVYDELLTRDFKITAPGDIKLTLDDVALDTYQTGTEGGKTVYTIPYIADTPHTLKLQTAFDESIFGQQISLSVPSVTSEFDICNYLFATGELRTKLIEIASNKLVDMNKYIIKQKWDEFCAMFAPVVNPSEYSAAFDKGYRAKSAVYKFNMLEYRDLQLADTDVLFTGHNTVRVMFGTKWQWAEEDNIRRDNKTNKVKDVRKWSVMRPTHVVELYYDGENWLLYSVDEESIARLTDALEQWR